MRALFAVTFIVIFVLVYNVGTIQYFHHFPNYVYLIRYYNDILFATYFDIVITNHFSIDNLVSMRTKKKSHYYKGIAETSTGVIGSITACNHSQTN